MTAKQIDLVERAHELAKSGEFEFVYQIERQLIADGYARVAVTFSDNRELRQALRNEIRDKIANKALGRMIQRK